MVLKIIVIASVLVALAACANSQRQSKWRDIDYSRVRDRAVRENDNNYTQPTVLGCTDDDLYNCR